MLSHLATGNTVAQVEIYQRLTQRLVAAGAEQVVVTSIAGHFCIEAFKALRVTDLIEATDRAVTARGLERVGILGTMTVMESGFYGGLSTAEVVPPPKTLIQGGHDAYVTMAADGVVQPGQREVFDRASQWLIESGGVESILLAGTDLALVYREETSPYPVLDCAAIHVAEVASVALGQTVDVGGGEKGA